ncbi:VOC family protein [Symbioplanes lichenis]|uniref:VOC family protein n=1 Tax=Symbioplanes lichenis TaxID=1629072 RepID=UPI0027386D3D|nr:hypothetical protein [Actinoplanes lichenis]
MDKILDELRRRGVDVVNEPFEIEDISARLAFFRDPWGTCSSSPSASADPLDLYSMSRSTRSGRRADRNG